MPRGRPTAIIPTSTRLAHAVRAADAGDATRGLVATGTNQVPTRSALLGGGAFLAAPASIMSIVSIVSPRLVFAFLLATSGGVILLAHRLIALAQIHDHRRHKAPGDASTFGT